MQVPGKGFLKEAVKLAGMKSCPVLLPPESGSKTGRHQWLRDPDRMSRVRASVRGQGAQPSARTKATRCAPPRRHRHGTTRSLAVKVALRAPYDRAPWRAVRHTRATARGSDVFALAQGSSGWKTKAPTIHTRGISPFLYIQIIRLAWLASARYWAFGRLASWRQDLFMKKCLSES